MKNEKLYYVAQYENSGEYKYAINDILAGPKKNMMRWNCKVTLEMSYGNMHECEDDAITEISILRLEYLKEKNRLTHRQFKDEVNSLVRWLKYHKSVKPHLFV